MKKTQLSKAIAFAITGAALSFGAVTEASAASTTMYNLYRGNFEGYDGLGNPIYAASSTTACAPCNNAGSTIPGVDNGTGNYTDGWVWDANPDGLTANFNNTQSGADAARPGWAGIGGSSALTSATPFGYSASNTLNWAVQMTGGGTAEISNADSIARYGQSADIDTAQGAWSDNSASAQGWKHDVDWGLFQSDVSGQVTLSITGVNNTGSNFGFTIFQGMSTNTAPGYSHHGSWNRSVVGGQVVVGNRNLTTGAVQLSAAGTGSVPTGTGFSTSDIVAYSVADNPLTAGFDAIDLNTITFNAVAGQIYTIALGGYRDGAWGNTTDGYSLTISAAPVPVPGAAWLFGGAIASLIGANRRKRVVPA